MIDQLLDRFHLEVPGCTTEEIMRCLGEAVEEVALESCAWVSDVAFVPTAQPNEPNHISSPVAGTRPGYVLHVRDPQGVPVPRLAVFPFGPQRFGSVLAWWSPFHGAVCFTTAVPSGASFTATVTLVPQPTALHVLPDGVWSTWREAVVASTLSRLFDTPSRPFYSQERADVERRKAVRAIGRLRMMTRQGHSYGGPVLAFPTRIGVR